MRGLERGQEQGFCSQGTSSEEEAVDVGNELWDTAGQRGKSKNVAHLRDSEATALTETTPGPQGVVSLKIYC